MKKKTIDSISTMHNRICRLNNIAINLDDGELSSKEKKELETIKKKINELVFKIYDFKTKVLTDRSIPIQDVL